MQEHKWPETPISDAIRRGEFVVFDELQTHRRPPRRLRLTKRGCAVLFAAGLVIGWFAPVAWWRW